LPHFITVSATPIACLIALRPHCGAFLVAHALPLCPTRIALGLAGLVRHLAIIRGFLRLCAAKDKQAGAHQQ
jgi:hypothetical protein